MVTCVCKELVHLLRTRKVSVGKLQINRVYSGWEETGFNSAGNSSTVNFFPYPIEKCKKMFPPSFGGFVGFLIFHIS